MALFKIEKGLAANLATNRPKANEGYAYFTTDDGKFYIDIAGNGTQNAVVGTNRICLNSAMADKVGHNLVLTINSGATEGTNKYTFNGSTTKNLNIASGSNVSFTTSAGALTISSNDYKVRQTNDASTNANYRLLLSNSASDTQEDNISRKNNNLIFNPSTGLFTTKNASVTEDLTVTGETYANHITTTGGILSNGHIVLEKPSSVSWSSSGSDSEPAVKMVGANNKVFKFKFSTSGQNVDVGWDWAAVDGAGAFFRTADATSSPGCFGFFARSSSGTSQLIGYPTGALTWIGRRVVTGSSIGSATLPVYINSSGYPVAITSYEGNSATATKFASAQSVTLTGDVTGTASSQAGWSVATTLANSGVTAGSYGPSANATPAHAGSFTVPYITVDAKGRVTSASTKTITLPSDNNTDTLVTQTATDTYNLSYELLFSGTADNTTRTETARKSSNLVYNPSTGLLSTKNISLTGDITITGDAYLNSQTYAEDITTNTLIVNGNASVIDSVTAPKFYGHIEGTDDAASPTGALLQSGSGRADSSPGGDTWIFWDTLGGSSSYWGIRHNQSTNTIGFYGSGSQKALIYLGESKITATTFDGNATTANAFASAKSITLSGDVTGTASSTGGWSITTSIGSGKVTNAMLAGSIANGKLVNSSVSIAGNSVSLGGSLTADTLRTSLGLSNAMHFIGVATVTITDGSTTDPQITGYTFSSDRRAGDVVIDSSSSREYVWSSVGKWELLGGDSSYKTVQSAVSSPSASGSTTAFIDTISQNANGVITVTKKNLDTSGTWSGNAVTATKANITTTQNAVAKYSDTNGTFADSNVRIENNNLIIGSMDGSTVVGAGNFKIGVQNDSYGIMPYANNWNQIGASNLFWYKAYVTNYYGTTSYITNWASNNNIGTPASSSAASTIGKFNLYNTCAAAGTQTKTTIIVDSTTAENITLTLPKITGTIALTSSDITGNAATASAVAWVNVTGKPSTYYTLPTATSSALGGIKVGYTTSENNRAVQVDSNGNAYVVQKDTNTWRGIQNNLTSDSTTDSLSAAQGKALKALIDGKTSNTGTVTSVAASGSGGISISGSPITTSGTLSIGLNLSTAINGLTEGSSNATRGDYIVAQYAGGGTTTTTYRRRKISNIFAALNSTDITTALGYTPYNSTNPNGYTTNTGTVTSITLTAGDGISIGSSGTAITTSGSRTISHADTSTQASVSASSRRYITGITLDTYGHVTGLSTGTETVTNTDQYVNQSKSTTANWRKVLLHYTTDASSTTSTGTSTNVVYGADGVAVQPSTGTLRSTIFNVADKVNLQYNSTTQALDFVFA